MLAFASRAAAASAVIAARSARCSAGALPRGLATAAAAAAPGPVADVPASNKLRARRRWLDFAPYVSELKMQYDPVNGGVAGAIELWKMASGSAVRRAYPKYTISLEEHEDGRPAKIEIAYANKQKQVIEASGKKIQDILDEMAELTEAMQEKDDMDSLEKN